MIAADRATEDLLRELAPQVLATLVRRFGDFPTAEDALQEALLAAATQWPVEGRPDNPRGWLIQVAQRRMADAVRAEVARRNRETVVALREPEPAESVSAQDDSLMLLFLCCHPALPPASAIALTLRAVGGLTTAEIARAFLLPEATMAQRITRAKKRLAALDRPFAPPADDEWRARLDAVLHVLYLIFTEGHTAMTGDRLRRADLSAEAIRLTRAVYRILPDDPEVGGLLALMLLTDARRDARTGPHGELIPLPEQDRGRWDRTVIAEGIRLATATLDHGLIGPYQIQAAIAVLHAQATCTETTDWERVLALYRLLERIAPNPMVTLNRAVATAMVDGPAAGLALTDTVADALADSHRLAAVRGHLYEMAGEHRAAVTCYTAAAQRTTNTAERDYLMLRAAHLRSRMAQEAGATHAAPEAGSQ
ncbi:sigma-70 family RNA polymerase sigma factor [Nocardia cyriacigeorgica]|uniref:RNA polymerase sigma factor n=1 Tax=Nocardia cyriacigeorgica TaxID=135487 RepID=UPI001894B081|nr:sigma-70 family RNA polymerase sigma factor [Nocardia cyriacigeorgica]MBF6097865.1 sigma-70 family RNA polymerase sigma factor [Nocardia cyriacigeorgica]MBF6158079.1 sigma-70 family RNA polymerase sigma factor [Nocardia cyriacigeorgica]MBF6197051.1 sigma-70 family RNA polymerase sigma factor [Nocardia cyriacigeorgica]MBF6317679.1 sigma-70 family RNA polymerase sigma factor [Nocardia cyriacigeorgica]MBF6398063.1 sigma-70 family RNA polymerase sigma factor [Nocardia cyriacigeorgica]